MREDNEYAIINVEARVDAVLLCIYQVVSSVFAPHDANAAINAATPRVELFTKVVVNTATHNESKIFYSGGKPFLF